MMESASESTADNNVGVAAASTNNNDNNAGRVDVILVQRYRCLERNVIAALCNAAQEPGLGDNFSLVRNAKPDFNRKVTMEDLRMPHIYDVMKVLTEDDVTLLTANPGSTSVFVGCFESDVEEFKRMSPKFFFIICDLLIAGEDPLQGLGDRAQLVVPVILKGGYYYIIPGRENTPLYRIHHPEQFFFSAEGRCTITRLLTQWHCHNRGDALSFLSTREGKLLMYCLPKVTDSCGFPNEMWGNLTEEQIKPNIPFRLVHEPSVPTHAHYSVQLVRLNDSNNIVDIDISGRA